MVRFPHYWEIVIIPKLIDSNAIDNKTPSEAQSIIHRKIGVQKRRAQAILAELERRGYIRRDPAQLPRIHIIKKGATNE